MSEYSPPEASGQVIATLRKAAGWTQRQLADRAHVSLSLLSKVEVGDRAASHALLATTARALRVPVERLSGQPYTDTRHDQRVHRDVDALRTVLRCYDLPDEVPLRSVEEIATDVAMLARLRAAADYGKLAARLPALLAELIAAAHHVDTTSLPQANALLVSAYHAAHTLTHRLGYPDLAESIEHKLANAAERTGDPLAGGLAQWARAQSFQAAGDYQHGLRLMTTARDQLDDQLRMPTSAALTVCGSLHLRSVTLASRAGDAEGARDHLIAARDLAARLKTGDQVHLRADIRHCQRRHPRGGRSRGTGRRRRGNPSRATVAAIPAGAAHPARPPPHRPRPRPPDPRRSGRGAGGVAASPTDRSTTNPLPPDGP
jgi:transcriptional regulator with XRE-family HTH domain